ncbi:MAG: hypothetical protein AB2L14_32495 [Candidatus Xenobiia bacterium LiM19]
MIFVDENRKDSIRSDISIRCSHVRGFTIIEILVAAVLLILLLSLIFAFLTPTMKAAALGSTRAEIQQEALRALDALCHDLLSSASSGISLITPTTDPEKGPTYLGIIRVENVGPLGNNFWAQSLIVYSWKGTGSPLIRKVWTSSSPPSLGIILPPNCPARFQENTLSKIADEPGLKGQVLARDVSELCITSEGMGSSVSSPLDLSITITRKAATGRNAPESFHLNRSICLRYQL